DVDNDLYCYERPLVPNNLAYVPKEKNNWNVATFHLRRAIGFQCPREILWIKTLLALDCRGTYYETAALNWARRKYDGEFVISATRIDTLEAYEAWEKSCDKYLEYLREMCRNTSQPISTGAINLSIAKITRLESLRITLRSRFVHEGSGHAESSRIGLSWLEIDTAFNNRVLTGAVVNSNYIEPQHFLDNARDVILDKIRLNLQRHVSLKVNTVFYREFVADTKRSVKSITMKNYELYGASDLKEWYDEYVVDAILSALEEFQERDSGWALSCILNLIVNVNKFYPMHSGCSVSLPRRISLKKAIINVEPFDNACFAWSIVAALYLASTNPGRTTQYPHYLEVLRLEGIDFPVIKQITRFENLNDISVNVFIEREREARKRSFDSSR
ncbi:hypothetical protein ALC62_12747, partial [Cyphomyrmex costatus]